VKKTIRDTGINFSYDTLQHLLFFHRELNTVSGDVIQKRSVTVAPFLTRWAFQPLSRELRDIGLTVFPHEMNNPICLCKSLIRATGTLEIRRILF
jgi:hypothetical protein